MPAKFITLEGLDGCGKTTQLSLLENWFIQRGCPYITTAEPGGTGIGREIRRLLLDSRNTALTARAELLLYSADRAQHVSELVRPALAADRMVISDRYTDATLAFQGYGRGFDLELCRKLSDLATDGLHPDLTLLFDLDVEVASDRIRDRLREAAREARTRGYDESRLDNEKIDFHRRVRAGYLEIAATEPERVRVINAGVEIEQVWQATKSVVEQFFACQS